MPWLNWYNSLSTPPWTVAPLTTGLLWQIRWGSVAQLPYFVWVLLATVLQLSITAMTWGRP